MKRISSIVLILLLCFGLMAGCSGSNGDPSQTDGDKAHTTLNLRIATDITSLDPQVTTVNAEYCMFVQIFEGLVKFNGSKFEAVPCLAENWTISKDGKEYTFNLRKDVKWHDGSDFTADDVVFTINRCKNMPSTSSKAAIIESVEKLDDYTVKLVLSYAYPNFILQLASYPWCIVNQKVVEQYGDDNNDMLIGTGAYKFISNTTGIGVTLEANDKYWGGEPYFKTVNYKLIPDNNTALTALLTGEIDMDTVNSTLDVDYVNKTEGYTVHDFQRSAAYFLAFNQTDGSPLSNEYFRKAIAYAIDKQDYVTLVWNDQAYVCPKATMLSKGEEGYCDNIPSYDYDVEKAKEMLDKSGLSKEQMKFTLTVSTAGYGPAIGAALQESMKAIGVDVTLNSVEAGALTTAFFAGEYEAVAHNLATIPYNAPLFYKIYYKNTAYVGRGNALGLEEKIDEAGKTIDDASRIAMYEDISVKVGESCMYIPIAYQKMNYACPVQLKGMDWFPSILSDYICNWYWEE